jgi:hypothetical protein
MALSTKSSANSTVRVILRDGTAIDLREYRIEYQTVGNIAQLYGWIEREIIPVYKPPYVYVYPLKNVESIKVNKPNPGATLFSGVIKLKDGRRLAGDFKMPKLVFVHDVEAVKGNVVMEGYPGKIEVMLYDISEIAVSSNDKDEIVAQIVKNDKSIIRNITNLKCRIYRGKSTEDSYKAEDIELGINGNTKIKIPIDDISKIQKDNGNTLVVLKSGKILKGTIGYLYIWGAIDLKDDLAEDIYFNSTFYEIKSLEFTRLE